MFETQKASNRVQIFSTEQTKINQQQNLNETTIPSTIKLSNGNNTTRNDLNDSQIPNGNKVRPITNNSPIIEKKNLNNNIQNTNTQITEKTMEKITENDLWKTKTTIFNSPEYKSFHSSLMKFYNLHKEFKTEDEISNICTTYAKLPGGLMKLNEKLFNKYGDKLNLSEIYNPKI